MTTWADPPLSRREARQKVREEAGTDTVPESEEELAAAAAAEEAGSVRDDTVVRRNGAGGRRAQWSPAPITSSFAPIQPMTPPEAEDNTSESQAEVMPELTMTRRELRALRERAAAAGQPIPDIVFLPHGLETRSTPVVQPEHVVAEPVTGPETLNAPSEPQAVIEQTVQPEVAPQPAGSDAAAPIPDLIEPSSADWTFRATRPTLPTTSEANRPESSAPEVATADAEHDLEYIEAEIVEEVDSPAHPADASHAEAEPADSEPGASAPSAPETLSPFDALFRPAAAGQAGAAPSPVQTQPAQARAETPPAETPAKPYGHWTTQAALDDAAPSIDGFLSRDVGVTTGAITTHALVLPSIPESGDQLLAPLTTTGEIMVTGSIDLPRTFGSTGAHPARFDHPDVDALIDESDREDAESTSAPVRAIRAVSSTSSTRGVIEAPAKPKSRLPLIGGIVLGGIILVAGAFVAAALIFNVF